MQPVRELPFDERPRALLAVPEVAVAGERGHGTAAPVMAQYVALAVRGLDKERCTPPPGVRLDLAPRGPVARLEPVGAHAADAGGVVEHGTARQGGAFDLRAEGPARVHRVDSMVLPLAAGPCLRASAAARSLSPGPRAQGSRSQLGSRTWKSWCRSLPESCSTRSPS